MPDSRVDACLSRVSVATGLRLSISRINQVSLPHMTTNTVSPRIAVTRSSLATDLQRVASRSLKRSSTAVKLGSWIPPRGFGETGITQSCRLERRNVFGRNRANAVPSFRTTALTGRLLGTKVPLSTFRWNTLTRKRAGEWADSKAQQSWSPPRPQRNHVGR